MKTKSIILLGFLFAGNITLYSQNYASMPVKEEFDAYNIGVTNRYRPCDVAADSDYSVLGDGMAYVLDAYVTMYKTTKDKAYLYNFILQSLCMMDNRHDFDTSYPNNEPRWSWGKYIYQDGNIIGAMAYFTYFVRIEEPNLYYEGLYPFEKLSDNMWNQTFTTFGQYADWLCLRVSETLDWFNTHSYWGNSGYKRHPEKEPAEINQQAGMGRALLFIGKAFSNTSYLSKAITILLLYKSTVSFYDACHVRSYDNPVFILNSSANAYWWYHSGWRVARECLNTKSYEQYTKFFEDLSHGALTLSLVLDYYNCLGLFSTADMVRFRNTFTKLLYNGDGTFNNAVNGADNPIFHNGNSDSEWPHNLLKMSSMAYMPFSRFDNLSTAPNVYNIIMNFYAGNVSNMAIPLNGMDGLPHKGHAETVKAQWERECPNLSLYNRDVVYHQDFFAKHNLVIEPQQSSGRSYADPVIHTPDFIVEPGVMANFTAGHEIVLKPGTVFKEGSYVIAAINPALCNAPSFALGNIQSDSIQNSFLDSTGNDTSIMIPVKMLVQTTPAPQAIKTEMEPTVALSPNPNNGTFTIETNFDPREITTVQIYNSLGQLAYSQAGLPQAVITVPGMSKGLFVIKITTATNQFIQKMVVQ